MAIGSGLPGNNSSGNSLDLYPDEISFQSHHFLINKIIQ